ncbi:oxidoreductase, partial [Priestia megaterium]
FLAGSQFLALDAVVFKKKETAFSLQEESSK